MDGQASGVSERTETVMSDIGLMLAGFLVLTVLGIFVYRRYTATSPAFTLPTGVTLTPAALLTTEEVVLYSLLRLAVQDHYLVFSQVPLWSFIAVEATDDARLRLLNRMALKRADFVLVHPGSRHVEQVIQFEAAPSGSDQDDRRRLIQLVLNAAGIRLVMLQPQHAYTVPELVSLLGMASDE